jgi:hypothetical protein
VSLAVEVFDVVADVVLHVHVVELTRDLLVTELTAMHRHLTNGLHVPYSLHRCFNGESELSDSLKEPLNTQKWYEVVRKGKSKSKSRINTKCEYEGYFLEFEGA